MWRPATVDVERTVDVEEELMVSSSRLWLQGKRKQGANLGAANQDLEDIAADRPPTEK